MCKIKEFFIHCFEVDYIVWFLCGLILFFNGERGDKLVSGLKDYLGDVIGYWCKHPRAGGVWIVVFLAILILLIRKNRVLLSTHYDTGRRNSSFEPDLPIEGQEDDRLNRGAFVSMLYNLVHEIPVAKRSAMIGLYAPWGEGKTSVVNLLKEQIRALNQNSHNVTFFADYSPWKYQNQDTIPLTFFNFLAKQLKKMPGNLNHACKRAAIALRLTYMERKIGGICYVVDLFRSLLTVFYSDEYVIEQFRNAMSQCGIRIVVVIDDLDRLPDDDVCQVMRFLKSHGDLPGIIYLIVADEMRLAEAVSSLMTHGEEQDSDAGRRYLEKLIPVSRQLPVVNGRVLVRDFERQLSEILESYWPEGINKDNVDLDYVLPYLNSVRSLKRMVNAIRVDLAFAKKRAGDHSYFGVDIGDYVILSVIREFEKAFYAHLVESYGCLLSHYNYGLDTQGVDREWMNRHFFDFATSTGKAVVERFVLERLGIEKIKDRNGKVENRERYRLHPQDRPEDILSYRLSSKLCFGGYFLSEFEDVQVSQSLIHSLIESVRKEEYPAVLVSQLDAGKSLPFVLYALEAQPLFDDERLSRFYMRTLIRIGESVLKDSELPGAIGEWPMATQNIYTRVFRCLLRYCQKMQHKILETPQSCNGGFVGDDIVCPILLEEHSVVMSAHFIELEHNSHFRDATDGDAQCLFSDNCFKVLVVDYLNNIGKVQSERGICDHIDFYCVFGSWIRMIESAGFAERMPAFQQANDKWLHDYQALSKMLEFFSLDRRQDLDNENAIAVDWPRMKRYWTRKQIEQMFCTLIFATNVSHKDRVIMVCLDFILGKPNASDAEFTYEAQQQYLKDNPDKITMLHSETT